MCDSVVAVGSETASRATLFAKNSDRMADECQPLLQFPESMYPPDAVVRCTHIEISQVAETYRVLGHSPWWVWGFEHGVNEHAVAIGNQTVFSKEPIEERPGLIGMDLVRLGLERGRTARESLEVIASLLESHGQGGAAFGLEAGGYHNSFMLADPDEAWVLETSNRHWAARRVALGSLSNHHSIGSDWDIGSRHLAAFASQQGWWTGTGRIDVASAYRNPNVPGRISEGRMRRSRELLEADRGHHDVGTLTRLLRDHLDGGPAWQPGSTPDDERHFTLCAHSEPIHWTTASVIAELPSERGDPWPIWISFATPCSGVFLPVYINGVIPAALAQGGKKYDPDSAWWAFKRLQDRAGADPGRHTLQLREGWSEFETAVETERIDVEKAARMQSRRGDGDGAAQLVTHFMDRTCARAIDRANELSDRIA
jgi:secernin